MPAPSRERSVRREREPTAGQRVPQASVEGVDLATELGEFIATEHNRPAIACLRDHTRQGIAGGGLGERPCGACAARV